MKGDVRCVGDTAVSLLDALSDQRLSRAYAQGREHNLTFAPGWEESGIYPKGSVLGRVSVEGRAGRRARTYPAARVRSVRTSSCSMKRE